MLSPYPFIQRQCLCTPSKTEFSSLTYFGLEEEVIYPTKKEISLYHRRRRPALLGFSKTQALLNKPRMALQFKAGDILEATITKDLEGHSFTGICLAIRKASLTRPNTTVILRNIISKVGIEVIFSLFENRAYRIRFKDHLRKSFFYSKNKLLYLRYRRGMRAIKN